MHEQPPFRTKKLIIIMFLIGGVILTLFYYDIDILKCSTVIYPTDKIMEVRDNITHPDSKTTTPKTLHNTTTRSYTKPTYVTLPHHNVTPVINTIKPDVKKNTDLKFLVSNPNCKMLDLDPFNEEARRYFSPEKYKSCRSLKLLTYVTKTDNIATLHIDNDLIPSYSKNGVSCCFSTVTRKHDTNNPDAKISISPCQTFENNVTLHTNPVIVKCQNKRHKQVYENAHVSVTITDDVQKKINNSDNNTRTPSILFVGIDSISRLNFIRSLPNTYKYIEENGWLPLKGYNKIDDNTFPNLMAILAGFNSSTAYKVCNPKVLGKLNNCPMVWYDYKKLGYVTGYAEDDAPINTFNYNKIGFREPPTDYYFRSYIMATEKLTKITKDELVYCTGPETAGERIMNLAKDFAVTFRDYPNFGFFWMNSFSHNKINSPTGMDNKIKTLLKDLESNGVLKNSIVVFLSDHGMRFGNIRMTNTGWLEERLPFIYFSFPKWFQEKFQRELHNFKINRDRLTSPFDLHLTLQHILKLTGKNYTLTPADGCPKCRSLFEEMDTERSCEDAGITTHWCTCHGYIPASFSKDVQDKLTGFILKHIHNVIRLKNHDHSCAKYSVERVLSMRISQRISNRNETSVLTQFQTKPKAMFESTITFDGDIDNQQFYLSGDISRLDSYSDVSKCVKDAYLKKYCYCRSHGERI